MINSCPSLWLLSEINISLVSAKWPSQVLGKSDCALCACLGQSFPIEGSLGS